MTIFSTALLIFTIFDTHGFTDLAKILPVHIVIKILHLIFIMYITLRFTVASTFILVVSIQFLLLLFDNICNSGAESRTESLQNQ